MNSRVKDLPDIALLASIGELKATRVRAAIEQTFTHRATHPIPATMPDPPDVWRAPYAALAMEDDLPWATLDLVTVAARLFLDPVLADDAARVWDPTSWSWKER